MQLFTENAGTSVCLLSKDGAIRRAAEDLCRNLTDLSNCGVSPAMTNDAACADILIAVAEETGIGYPLSVPEYEEGYAVEVGETRAFIVGRDVLGTVYGIYAFCERLLGVDPMYRFTDIFPQKRDRMDISPIYFESTRPKVHFRGWFINDEDLLTDFKEGGGTRDLDYPFYEHVVHPDVMDMVLETALRCGMNLIIPASFVDIANPDEEALVRAAYERGLYISQHHIEPLGVSHFTAETYLKKRGMKEAVSFVENPERMKEIWRHYAVFWSKYADRVIWQLGLRGRGDKAVWMSDPNVASDAETRGKLISGAVAAQHEILCDVLGGKKFYSTVTLWLEGAALYDSGYLSIPHGTTVVFSDVGTNQMLGDDFFNVERRSGSTYGIYYHITFWGHGPHLAEGASPEKILYCLTEAERRNSLEYVIMNVSNIRPVHFGVLLGARILQNPSGFDLEAYRKDFYRKIFGEVGDAVGAGMKCYFDCLADFGQPFLRAINAYENSYYHDYGKLPFTGYAASDGLLFYSGTKLREVTSSEALDGEIISALRRSITAFESLVLYWDALAPRIPVSAQIYYACYPVLETRYMLLLTRWCLGVYEMFSVQSETEISALEEKCVFLLETARRELDILEYGKWKGWLHGERKINFPKRIKQTKEIAEKCRFQILKCGNKS